MWAPDGRTIAFTSTAAAGDLEKPAPNTANKDRTSDVKVVTSAVYRANGNPAYVDQDRHSHIWTTAVSDGGDRPAPAQVTRGEFNEGGPVWTRDGSAIYFTSDRVADSYYQPRDADLYMIPAAGGTVTRVASIDGTIGNVSVSPDGKRLAFVGSENGTPVRSYSQPDLWVVDAAPDSTPKNLTAAYDFDINGGIGGDQAAPRGEQPKPIVWTSDGLSLIVVSGEHGSANFKRVSIASGKIEPLTSGLHDIVGFTATPDGSTIAATLSTQTSIGDIAIVRASGGAAPVPITRVNEDLFRDITQSEPEELWYTSFDGKKVQGWILKPPGFDPSRKYPLILEIHGGPHAAYGNTYTHEFMWMAARGYVVLFTNPRGSTTYG